MPLKTAIKQTLRSVRVNILMIKYRFLLLNAYLGDNGLVKRFNEISVFDKYGFIGNGIPIFILMTYPEEMTQF